MNSPGRIRLAALPGRAALLVIAVAATLALAGCNDTQLVNVWSDPSFRGHELHGVLAVSRETDPAERRIAEDAIHDRLSKAGIEVVRSYEVYPDGPPSKNDMEGTLNERNLDAAIIFKPIAPTSDTRYVPGWSSTEPRFFYDPWAGHDVVVYRRRYHPGYHYTERYDRTQVTLWVPEDEGRMVWAGTALVPAGSGDGPAPEIAQGIVPALKDVGLLPEHERRR